MTPLALARLHAAHAPGDLVDVDAADEQWLEGAGFAVVSRAQGRVSAERLRTLPDIVGREMRVLVCGLNPSLYSADAGVNFARPGNRFWPAALDAGLVSRDRDPSHALRHHKVGFTDLVKRATVGADELARAEYVSGAARLSRLVGALKPRVVCFVGLTGWRTAVDRDAVAGVQPAGFAGAMVYVMPNTSGLNAHTTPAGFVTHLSAVVALADGATGCRGRNRAGCGPRR